MSLDLLQAWLPSLLAGMCAAAVWFLIRRSTALALAVGALGLSVAVFLTPPARDLLTNEADASGVPSNAVRFRVEVSLLVDGELVTRNVVQQIVLQNRGGSGLPNITGVDSRLSGQALLFTFTDGPAIAVLPTIEGETHRYTQAIEAACGGTGSAKTTDEYIQSVIRHRGECRGDWMPDLLSIADVSDPASIRWVKPADLASVLGAGARLVSVRVSTTDEPLTRDLEAALPMLASNPDFARLDLRPRLHRDLFISRL